MSLAGSLRIQWLRSCLSPQDPPGMPRTVRLALRARGLYPGHAQDALPGICGYDSPRACSGVVLAGISSVAQLEDAVGAVAAGQAPGSLLVLTLTPREQRALERTGVMPRGLREWLHLLLLRCGYAQVWAHRDGEPLCVSARRLAQRGPRMCSIIVPVYNEKDTFPELMRRLLAKSFAPLGLVREIIVVESHSSDGTREQVEAFASTPTVRVLWQSHPQGKGHAVCAALERARGDIVLIQDADLEYDIEDYDALLTPLLKDEAAFVLGSRQGTGGRMRRMPDQPLAAGLLDVGHSAFTMLINVLYAQRLRDPFTMFKVFRRDCLYGLRFECRRFDFDHELLIKLLLKGYQPLEVPVRYQSRSFRQGKKIRPWRDALSWVKADLKYRVQPLRHHLD